MEKEQENVELFELDQQVEKDLIEAFEVEKNIQEIEGVLNDLGEMTLDALAVADQETQEAEQLYSKMEQETRQIDDLLFDQQSQNQEQGQGQYETQADAFLGQNPGFVELVF